MDTKKFNANGQGKAKAGRDNTRVILTAAGLAASAAAGAGAAHIFSGKENEDDPEKQNQGAPVDDKVKPKDKEEEAAQQTSQQSSQETSSATSAPSHDNDAQPQPTTGNGQPTTSSAQQPAPEHQQEPSHPTGGETPQEVAEQIAQAEEIDKDDIDAPAMVEIDGFTTAYDENGNEMAAVMTHTPDGTPFLLVDVDGDGTFEGVFDTNGNFVAQAEANLTHSDLEAMMDQSGGFLALNEHDVTHASDDPTNDIIDTETGTHPDMAMNEPAASATPTGNQEEQPDVVQQEETSADEIDNLLAELLGSDTDSDSKGLNEEVLVDEYEDTTEVNDVVEDDDDSDDDSDDDDSSDVLEDEV